MGISGLLPFLKKIHEQVNIARFKGCTVAIDAYCWLHKGAFSCAEKLAMKEDTDQYVYYCMKYINYILAKDVKPIMVFDGCHLESKAGVEKTRRERRELHRKRAAQFLREGKRNEAKDCLQKCVDITPQMALKLIQACRDRGVDCIVAPYEADAQLAYLNLSGIAQVIVTEDSDLLLFGCDKIIFKMDFFGNGTLIEKNRLNEVLAVDSGFYTFDKFRHMCILSGCDYLPNLPGIGLATANKVFKLARQGDIRLLLKKLSTYLKKNLTVTDDYVDGFIKADNTFLYQLVFDPLHRMLKPLNPYPPELEGEELGYAGHQIPRQMAYQIALGNIDIHTQGVMADFDPDTFVPKNQVKAKYRHQLSIWDKNYAVKSGSPCKEIQPCSLVDSSDKDSILARGRIAPRSKVIKLTQHSDDHQNQVLKVTEVLDVYNNAKHTSPKKSARKRIFDNLDDIVYENETTKRRRSQDDLENPDDMPCNDENDRFSPLKCAPKFSPVKLSKIRYDASNIGEEAFKEDKIPRPRDESKTESSNVRQSRNIFAVSLKRSPMPVSKAKYDASNIDEEAFKEDNISQGKDKAKTESTNVRQSRNIFAVSKTAKSSLNANSSSGTKSKYFSNASAPPKVNTVTINKLESGENISETVIYVDKLNDKESSTSKKEIPKPSSLREMFKNLKDKKAAVEENCKLSPLETTNKGTHSHPGSGDAKRQNCRTPSAFSWSKFKFNSSSSNSNSKSSNSHSKSVSPLQVTKNARDSFSELLKGGSHSSSSSNCSSSNSLSSTLLSSSSSPSISRYNSNTELVKRNNEQNVEKVVSTTTNKNLDTLGQTELSATTPDCDVTEVKSQSYESFLKSMTSGSGDASLKCVERLETDYDKESPYPDSDKKRKLTQVVDVDVIECEENPVELSQESVIDLTQGDSQTSNSSGVSRSSSTSVRSKCRVSGLSKRKGQVKKSGVPKCDANQKSIKDLFSKFAFKKETEPKPTAISTSYSVDSLEDSSDEDLSETPISKSFDISNADVVRRKLLL